VKFINPSNQDSRDEESVPLTFTADRDLQGYCPTDFPEQARRKQPVI
jgi:hypothetical protein